MLTSKNQEPKERLCAELQINFPTENLKPFRLYPFANDHINTDTINSVKYYLDKLPRKDQLGCAMLFGESRFISLLPELEPHVDVIILADINPLLHAHTKYLLECLQKSNSIGAFLVNYIVDDIDSTLEASTNAPALVDAALLHQGYYFLGSEERYMLCRETAKNLSFIHIGLDILNAETCSKFASLLQKSQATLRFCNVTNISQYDRQGVFAESIKHATMHSPECVLMASKLRSIEDGELLSQVFENVTDFQRSFLGIDSAQEPIKYGNKIALWQESKAIQTKPEDPQPILQFTV